MCRGKEGEREEAKDVPEAGELGGNDVQVIQTLRETSVSEGVL